MRKFFLILCAFVLVHPVWALDVDYRLGLGAGWIMPDGKVDLMVPYSQTLREQYLEGTLVMPTHDKKYMQAIKTAVEAVR